MNTSERVEAILKYDKQSRDSDKRLLIVFMQKAGMDLTPRQMEIFKEMPSMETIRRIRQKIQEQGKYPASEEVDNARFEKYQQVKYGINNEDPERILEAQGYKVLPWGQ